jgi:hypothetical protein
MKKQCLQCKKDFQKPYTCGIPDWTRRRFCSVNCHNVFRTGKSSPSPETAFRKGNSLFKDDYRIKMYGSKNHKWKGGQTTLLCKTCNSEYKVDQYRAKTSKVCSIACYNKYRSTLEFRLALSKKHRLLVEKKLGNIRSEATKLDKIIRKSAEYRIWREIIFKRDNYTCQMCGHKGNEIHADHVKQFALILLENDVKTFDEAVKCIELWDTKNGRTLCVHCHKATPTYARQIIRLTN